MKAFTRSNPCQVVVKIGCTNVARAGIGKTSTSASSTNSAAIAAKDAARKYFGHSASIELDLKQHGDCHGKRTIYIATAKGRCLVNALVTIGSVDHRILTAQSNIKHANGVNEFILEADDIHKALTSADEGLQAAHVELGLVKLALRKPDILALLEHHEFVAEDLRMAARRGPATARPGILENAAKHDSWVRALQALVGAPESGVVADVVPMNAGGAS